MMDGSNKPMLAARLALAICFLFLPASLPAATRSSKLPLVAKWERFEQTFKSTVSYPNPVQQTTFTVVFTSPAGETHALAGFWDGGKTWRVRFSPDRLGRWSYTTLCSDPKNKGLHNQSGGFLCSTPIRPNRFSQHGPVQVARGGRHFEHADGTPFFWLADIAWDGPQLARDEDWELYARVRFNQKFSAIQWAVAPGEDANKRPAFSGKTQIAVDPEFFQNLDRKLETLERAGLLNVIAPLRELEAQTLEELPEDQATLLLRYMIARWGANHVAWLLTFDGNRNLRWQRIGRDVFGDSGRALVIVCPGELAWAFDEFQGERWADAFGFGLGQNTDEDSLKWLVSGPPATAWKDEPARPILQVLPPRENAVVLQSGKRAVADDIRRALWLGLLLSPPAGVTYGAEGVANWNNTFDGQPKRPNKGDFAVWHKSLFLPGGKQMTHLADVFGAIDFGRLRPAPRSVASQPGGLEPRRHIAATETPAKDLDLIYVPEDRAVELFLDVLPLAPVIQWTNPRTGAQSPAVAVIGTHTCQMPTPDPGDWVLMLKAGTPAK